MAMSGSKQRNRAASAQGQEADIAVLAIDPHFQVYANPWFSVQAVACTEIISFPYTPSDLDPPGPKISLNHPRIAHVRKTVLFVTPPLTVGLGRTEEHLP